MKLCAPVAGFRKVPLLGVALSASALFALEFKVERDIPYRSPESLAQEGEYAKDRCQLDMRLPVGVTNFATVIHFHGGGIVKGKKGSLSWPDEAMDHDPIAQVSGGYRLLTNATPEQAVSDAAAAVAWTIKNISRYGGDPKKVFVTGISAGGYLTAMVGMDYSRGVPGETGHLSSGIWNPGVFSRRCTGESLPLRVDFIHRVEFEEVSGHRVLIKRGPGNRGASQCGSTHEATSSLDA